MNAREKRIRMEAKRDALKGLSTKPTQTRESGGRAQGYGTNNDTKLRTEMGGMPQVVESLVELSGIEPLASSLRTRRSPS
jgi:hypothetical protein